MAFTRKSSWDFSANLQRKMHSIWSTTNSAICKVTKK